jgi:hypothetical protein
VTWAMIHWVTAVRVCGPGVSPLPASLASLLAVFGPSFTAWSFRTFCGLACGFLAQTGKRTVYGMLAGAGLSRAWPHDRAHWFFARALLIVSHNPS